ncbi:TrmB family transcriptional regulator [Patescibacteria group bacterium]
MIENLLKTCGLNNSEQSVLLQLLKRGSTTASILSKITGIKRTTIYSILESLLITGLVTKQIRDKTNYFNAASPETIPKILENHAHSKYQDIKTATSLLKTELKNFIPESAANFGTFKVEAVESIATVYAQLEKAFSFTKLSGIFNPQEALSKEIEPLVKKFISSTNTRKANMREIMVAGPRADFYEGLIKNPNHHLKRIPSNTAIGSDIIIVNDYVLLLQYQKGRESVIKITEPDLRQSMLTVFNMLWEKY